MLTKRTIQWSLGIVAALAFCSVLSINCKSSGNTTCSSDADCATGQTCDTSSMLCVGSADAGSIDGTTMMCQKPTGNNSDIGSTCMHDKDCDPNGSNGATTCCFLAVQGGTCQVSCDSNSVADKNAYCSC